MTERPQNPRPMVRCAAGLDPDHRRCKRLEEGHHLFAPQLLTQNHLLGGVHPMKLEKMFRCIHANSANLFHGRSPLFEICSDLILAQSMPSGAVHPNTQGIAFERLATLLSDLLGLDISEGALVNILDAAKDAFAKATAAIRAKLLDGTILQSDETGLRVGKQNWWLWVFHHDDSALFVAAPSRAKKVVADFLGNFRPDFWVSDRYGGQMGWATVNHQVCLAHLIRDVQYAIDAGDDIFAPELRHLLGRACRIGRRRERLA